MDKREKLEKLADIMVNYSTKVKRGEKVLIRGYGFDSYPLVKEVYKKAILAGAVDVNVRFSKGELSRIFLDHASEKQLNHLSELDKEIADSYDVMIQIVADENPYELTQVDAEKIATSRKATKPLSDIMVEKRWCLFYYPNLTSAIKARKPLEVWEDFVLNCCIVDWKKVEEYENRFIEVMKKVDKVKILGEETELELSVRGQNWKPCCGKRNLPDGEIFTAPLKESVNGEIKFNMATAYQGQDFDSVKLWVKDGKVIRHESNNEEALERILNTDDGARYFGEFAFGLNEEIKEATKQIIFDEKMGKSLHMALGRCYSECSNGNDSNIHWDLVFNFEKAGAEVYFNEKVAFKGGKWVLDELKFLNEIGELFKSS